MVSDSPRSVDRARSSRPSLLALGVRCNNRCLYCAVAPSTPAAALPSAPQMLDETRAHGCLQALRAHDARAVAFVGGEPSLHPSLPSLIRSARQLGFESIILQTNARRLAYRGYARELAAAGLTRIEVTLAGPNRETHDYHTHTPGSFAQTLTGARAGRSTGLGLTMTLMLTRSSYRHATDMVDLAERVGAQAVHLAAALPRGAAVARSTSLVPRFESIARELPAVLELSSLRRLPVTVSGVPLCCLPTEARRRWSRLRHAGAVHAAICTSCAAAGTCSGIDDAYARRYGFGELVALSGAEGAPETPEPFVGLLDTA